MVLAKRNQLICCKRNLVLIKWLMPMSFAEAMNMLVFVLKKQSVHQFFLILLLAWSSFKLQKFPKVLQLT